MVQLIYAGSLFKAANPETDLPVSSDDICSQKEGISSEAEEYIGSQLASAALSLPARVHYATS